MKLVLVSIHVSKGVSESAEIQTQIIDYTGSYK